ncbi:MAG: HAD-IA family hydrolase [Phycisphaerae bacterium]|nr:HAD-IA family hydrolase [Phycisphaerae bacterium]
MSAAPRVVCFDLGGVVVRICGSFREGCDAAGVTPAVDLDRELDLAALSAIVHGHQSGELACDDFHDRVSRLAGGRVSAAELRRVHDAWILGEYDGMAELLEELHGAGIETACLSNTNPSHWRAMRGMPAFDRIRHRHASHLLRLCKPDPRIFRAFERETGFETGSILYFDDLVPNVLAAANAGWRAELVDPNRPTVPQVRAALRRHGVPA